MLIIVKTMWGVLLGEMFWSFEGQHCLHLRDQAGYFNHLILKLKEIWSFSTLELLTQPQDTTAQRTVIFSSFTVKNSNLEMLIPEKEDVNIRSSLKWIPWQATANKVLTLRVPESTCYVNDFFSFRSCTVQLDEPNKNLKMLDRDSRHYCVQESL